MKDNKQKPVGECGMSLAALEQLPAQCRTCDHRETAEKRRTRPHASDRGDGLVIGNWLD